MKIKQKNSSVPEQHKDDMNIRAASIELFRAEGEQQDRVRASVSSETPVLTYVEFNDQWQRVYEILDHSESSVDMSRCKDGLVILDKHWGDQVGLMPVSIKDRKLAGPIEFCSGERAKEIEKDALKKLRRNLSVGYRVNAASYRLEGDKDGIPVVRAMSWMPYEASFEPVPADITVGAGRSETNAPETASTKGTRSMKPEDLKLDADSVVEIYRLARAFDMAPGEADEHIKSGKSVEDFRALALKKAEADKVEMARKLAEAQTRKPEPAAAKKPIVILDSREEAQVAKRFSVFKVLRVLSGVTGEDIAYEREVSAEIAKRSGRSAQGIMIPHCAPIGLRGDPFLKGSNGSNFVQTDLLIGQFIDVLRTKMVLAQAGVTTLSGLVGDVAIPKGGAITGGWVDGENGAGTEGKPTVSQVTGTPKTASGWTDISRRLLLQSGVDVEMFVQNELIQTLARLIEVAALHGTNANGQPKGLINQTGVNNPTVTANAPTRAQMISFLTDIMTDNAEFDGQSWLMRATGMGVLANTSNGSETILNQAETENVGGGPLPGFLLDLITKTMLGYPVHVTQNVANHHLFFGAWSQLVIGLWSGVDLTVDPYSNSTSGAVRIVALQDCDVMCRHGQAFAYSSTLTA